MKLAGKQAIIQAAGLERRQRKKGRRGGKRRTWEQGKRLKMLGLDQKTRKKQEKATEALFAGILPETGRI